MLDIKRLLLRAATCAVATTAAASVLSALYNGRAAAALNATSHIVWGDRAFRVDRADLSHTLVGVLLNAGAMLSWSVVHELLPEPRSNAARALEAAGVTALAYVTDYHLVPKRLTPGFEERLPPSALALVYLAMGVGFYAAPSPTARA